MKGQGKARHSCSNDGNSAHAPLLIFNLQILSIEDTFIIFQAEMSFSDLSLSFDCSDKFSQPIWVVGGTAETKSFKVLSLQKTIHEVIYHHSTDLVGDLLNRYVSQYGIENEVCFLFKMKSVASSDMEIGFYIGESINQPVVFHVFDKNEHELHKLMQNCLLHQNEDWVLDVILPTADQEVLSIQIKKDKIVLDLKKQVERQTGIKAIHQCLINNKNGYHLKDDTVLHKVGLQAKSSIYVIIISYKGSLNLQNQNDPILGNKSAQLFIEIDYFNQYKLYLPYTWVKDMNCDQIIKSFIDCKSTNQCLALGGKMLLEEQQQIKDLVDPSQLEYQEGVVQLWMRVVNLKYNWYTSSIREVPFRQNFYDQKIKEKLIFKNKKDKLIEKGLRELACITYYTCSLYRPLNLFLRSMNPKKEEQIKKDEYYCLWLNVSATLKKLNDSFNGIAYRGMRRFKFTSYNKPSGDIVCFESFTSTSMIEKEAKVFAKDEGSLLRIRSLTGKPIEEYSIYEYEKEVLFLPFTFFFIYKIDVQQKFDLVDLIEMPRPQTLKKNIILWIDDNPEQYYKVAREMQAKNGVQVLFMLTEEVAIKWDAEFEWILCWKKLSYRIITPIHIKYPFQGQVKSNAGLSLIKKYTQDFRKNNIKFMVNSRNPIQDEQLFEQAKIKTGRITFGSTPSEFLKFSCFR